MQTGDSSYHSGAKSESTFTFSQLSFEELRADLQAFATERNWDQFHTPRNLLLALTGEIGELAECFQWVHDDAAKPGLPGWKPEKRQHLEEELADCLLYLTRLAAVCHVDLPSAARAKMKKNAQKYPADKAYGSADKYHVYAKDA